MARPTPAAGAIPLVTGIATAAVLSATAVFAVTQAGCEHPGTYRVHDGIVELVGGCITAEDLPPAPDKHPEPNPRPLGEAGPPSETASADAVLRR